MKRTFPFAALLLLLVALAACGRNRHPAGGEGLFAWFAAKGHLVGAPVTVTVVGADCEKLVHHVSGVRFRWGGQPVTEEERDRLLAEWDAAFLVIPRESDLVSVALTRAGLTRVREDLDGFDIFERP